MLAIQGLMVAAISKVEVLQHVIEWIAGYSAQKGQSFGAYIKTPEGRRAMAKVLWIAAVLGALIISFLALVLSKWVAGNYRSGAVVVTVMWSVLIGTTALLFLSSKAITAVFGGLVGLSVGEAGSATGLISRVNRHVTELALQLSTAANSSATQPDNLIAMLVWISIVIVGVLCLPAFFRD